MAAQSSGGWRRSQKKAPQGAFSGIVERVDARLSD